MLEEMQPDRNRARRKTAAPAKIGTKSARIGPRFGLCLPARFPWKIQVSFDLERGVFSCSTHNFIIRLAALCAPFCCAGKPCLSWNQHYGKPEK
jgi:hypothetical protein